VTDGPRKDVVIDQNVMRLYGAAKDVAFISFFTWLRQKGTLTMSRSLLKEYGGGGHDLVFVLINEMTRDGRYNLIGNSEIDAFTDDRHYRYTCNGKDRSHARLVFLSFRKRLIAFDRALRSDVNNFKRIDGIQPCACKRPSPEFYS
jgi:hypothetical protein